MKEIANDAANGVGVLWLRIAVVYLAVGIGLGLFMGMTHLFQYHAAHAHLNLLGWATMALAGIFYHLFPALAASPLQRVHFWLHNLGLPVLMIGLIFLESGRLAVEPVVGISSLVVGLGVFCFVLNCLINLPGRSPARAPAEPAQPGAAA